MNCGFVVVVRLVNCMKYGCGVNLCSRKFGRNTIPKPVHGGLVTHVAQATMPKR